MQSSTSTSSSSSSFVPHVKDHLRATGTTSDVSPLENLISHLLASKRSLSSITHVHLANTLCTRTRTALSSAAVTNASISFLHSGVISQLSTLKQIQQRGIDTAAIATTEFRETVQAVDEADGRLRATLDNLRSTIVEKALRPEGEDTKSLLDFVDEGGVEGLVGVVREVVEQSGKAMKEFETTNDKFEEELQGIRQLLQGNKGASGSDKVRSRDPLVEILHEMEDHAREMAVNLESLVKHFDLCVTAVKHTEGGGDAAMKIAGEMPEGVDIDQPPPEPMNEEQLADMLKVLEIDANQVEDVVMEIQSHHADMQALYGRVEAHSDQLTENHASMRKAFSMLDDIGRKLPGYITQSQVFLIRWDEDKTKIGDQLEGLESGREVYYGFLRAYDRLLVEVGRRKAVELEMEKIVQAAKARLHKLSEDEAEDRRAFKEEHGYFLPSDLWTGFEARPLHFEVLPVNDQTARIPHLSASVIRRAIQRVEGDR